MTQKVHVINLYDNEIRFRELSYDEETSAREMGEQRALEMMTKPSDAEKSEYGTLYVYYQMIASAGDDMTAEEYFKFPSTFHNELVLAINHYLTDEVHTEAKRLNEEIRKKVLEEGKKKLNS